MLNIYRLSEQFADFSAYHASEQQQRRARLQRACDALTACSASWEALRDRVAARPPTPLVAGLREAPDTVRAAPDRPTPCTVVATDGSQIYPDRHVEPTCFVLNVSRVAFQYGTLERPLLEARPFFHYRKDDLLECFDEVLGSLTADFVSALRDEKELEALLETAHAARQPKRQLVALADGTLIRWMIRAMRNRDLEAELIARYTALLARFQEERLPLCSYVSMPGNAEMIALLRLYLEDEEAAGGAAGAPLEGLVDRWLFEETLRPGERSATFDSFSHIQAAYGPGNRICYFYVRVPGEATSEIGRVEVPRWVAEDDDLVDLVHSVVLSECRKGGGYPMILAEAHEQAVVRAQEKEVFYQLIEREMAGAGLRFSSSRKQVAKQRPRV